MTQTEAERMTWRPISGLPGDWKTFVRPDAAAARDRAHAAGVADGLADRMAAEQSAETGAIERLYSLGHGAASAFGRGGANGIRETARRLEARGSLVRMDSEAPLGEVIVDQYVALFAWDGGDLAPRHLRAVHAAACAHQEVAYDGAGREPLAKGEWRTGRVYVIAEGAYYEFCPPALVGEQADALCSMHNAHAADGVDPVVAAAWLYHRFEEVHPFSDGNGRAGRALACAFLMAHGYPPPVLRASEAGLHYPALNAARRGNLGPLVNLFADSIVAGVRREMSLAARRKGGRR